MDERGDGGRLRRRQRLLEALQGDVDDCHFPRGKKSVWGVFIFFFAVFTVFRFLVSLGATLPVHFFFCHLLLPDLFGLTFRVLVLGKLLNRLCPF